MKKFLSLLGSIIFKLFLAIHTVVFGILVIVTFPFGRKVQWFFVDRYTDAVMLTLRLTTGVTYSVSGKENLPENETCVFWAKHQSILELYILQHFMPRHTWVFKKILLHVPFFGWGLRVIEAIGIDRKGGRSAVEQIIDIGTQRLNDGISVMLFPEGTRMPIGKTRKYGRSGAYLAKEAGHKIVPIAHNAGEFWGRQNLIINPGEVKIVIGSPIDPTNKTVDEISRECKAWIEQTMRNISPVYAEKAAFYEARGDQDTSGKLKDSRKT
jgi:1-acyl-sn-glycerol-3-phosphate acyltransferase